MFRFTHLKQRLLLGVLAGVLMLGGSMIQQGEALAGFGSSPGSREQTPQLMKSCSTGKHLPEVKIELM